MFSQSMRVVLPKMPALGYWEAWMCVSVLPERCQRVGRVSESFASGLVQF